MRKRLVILSIFISWLFASAQASPAQKTASPKDVSDFRKACRRLAHKASLMSVMGLDGWLLMDNELEHLAAGEFWGKAARKTGRARRPAQRNPLPAILDAHKQFSALGIRLIVLPIPAKSIIYPDAVWSGAPRGPKGRFLRLDPDHQKFYALLREKGVEVMDFTDLMLEQGREKEPALYCRHDTHY